MLADTLTSFGSRWFFGFYTFQSFYLTPSKISVPVHAALPLPVRGCRGGPRLEQMANP